MDIVGRLQARLGLIRGSRSPLNLLLDSIKLAGSPYIATSGEGISLELRSGVGEWYTFYENLVRQDYLKGEVELKSGDLVIDIGANIGAFAVLAARKVGPAGRVYACEPDPTCAQRLQRNIELNRLSNVTIVQAAVSGSNGRATFHRCIKSAYSSLFDGVDGRTNQHSESFDVELLDINELISRCGGSVALMKVNCEGAEYDIFEAIRPEIAARVARIAMEIHAVPGRSTGLLRKRMEDLGFRVQESYPHSLRHSTAASRGIPAHAVSAVDRSAHH